MAKRIIITLSAILIIITSILGFRIVEKIKEKRDTAEANQVFNEHNEKYISEDELTGNIEYKSDTMTININNIKERKSKLKYVRSKYKAKGWLANKISFCR